MCGIAGILATGTARPPGQRELEAMIGAVHHRGPDGYGYLVDGAAGLAHARLSIIDLATGDQPIFNEDRSVAVVFNGEIFNYIELRAALQARGHRFTTTSDTEVIVHLYEERGERFVDELNGQFAIALWDAPRRRLVLARDRVGIRPLYYAWHGGRLVFGSEVKSILAEGGIAARLDPRALVETFSYWSPLPGRSAFQDIASLKPGHVMVVEADGSARTTCYWDWNFDRVDDASVPLEARVDELRALLEDAVRLQLRADVPVGTYLSGGLDSSAVTAVASRLLGGTVRAFSLTFEDAEFDESGFQTQLADALGIDRTQQRCGKHDIASAFATAVRHVETPIVRTAAVPLMLLSRHVRESGYKVVLTGEGADEVFAGYDLFREARIRRWVGAHPQSAWRGRLFERLYPYLANSPTRGRALTQQFFAGDAADPRRGAYAHIPRIRATQRALQFLSADLRAETAGFDAAAELDAALPGLKPDWPALGRDQYVEAHTLMSGYLLVAQGDRVAMASSIEGRFPFLDHRVIEFACRLRPSAKLFGLREKHILKRAVAPWVPASIVDRTKQPYRAPDSQSFFAGGRSADIVADLLSPERIRRAGYFDADAVGRLVDKCRAGRAIGFGDNMAFVGVLSTMALHDAFIGA